jgi:uncharacterized NAD(P)/FAD-binding protein YdhS
VRTVAIIGAGFSGTMVAVHLLRAAPPSLERVLLVERSRRDIGGVAYETPSASHTLNVPAGRMSAFEDDPDHFLRYARRREPSLTGGSFVPRREYGAYLADTLDQARRESSLQLLRVSGQVVGVREETGGVVLSLDDGRELRADRAVLAIGNYPPSDLPVADPGFYASLRYARDPWSPDACERDPGQPVLLLGTGLTMLDLALALRDSDQQAPIYALSRRGLLPQAHRVAAKPPPHLDPPATLDRWPDTALGMLRELRREVREAAGERHDWREVVTSIRDETPALWQRLSPAERERFLRHVRPYWETHRHRSSPETALAIETMLASGALQVIAGRLVGFEENADGVTVSYRRRGRPELETLRVGKVVNCTGPDTDLERVREPLVASLLREGLVRPDPLGLGLDSDEEGRLLDAEGHPSARLVLVGPLRKGRLWENTAVPELRREAERTAALLPAAAEPAHAASAPAQPVPRRR